jgi:hypothetical protein
VMDSVTGRFLSADPFVQFPFDGQSFNRYSYVRNNPLSFTDPTGFLEDDDVRRPSIDDWEPSTCWYVRCWWAPPRYPRPNIIPRPKAQIPMSRSTPQAVPGPAVLPNVEEAENKLKDWVVGGIDVVTDFVPGVSTVKGIYQAYKVFSDPNSTTLDKVIATAGLLPGGKGAKYGAKIIKAVDSAGDAGKAAAKGPMKSLGGSIDDAAAKARTQPHRPDTVSTHARDRMETRGVSYESTQEAVRNGTRSFDPATGVATYNLPASASSTGRAVTVIRNDITGNIISVIDKGSR